MLSAIINSAESYLIPIYNIHFTLLTVKLLSGNESISSFENIQVGYKCVGTVILSNKI